MDLKKFWDTKEPLHRWSMPEMPLHEKMMGDLVEWIRFMASDNTWPRILDVGCGFGRLFSYLSKEHIDADVTMVDFVETALDLCEKTTGHRPDEWDGETLPYEDNSFDLVVMMDFLLHVHPDKVGKVLEEAKRVSNHYIYANTTVWDQPVIKKDTWCFSHNYTELFDGLIPVMSKGYEAKKELRAYLFKVYEEVTSIGAAIAEGMEDFQTAEVGDELVETDSLEDDADREMGGDEAVDFDIGPIGDK